jgi:hypothetical protein
VERETEDEKTKGAVDGGVHHGGAAIALRK